MAVEAALAKSRTNVESFCSKALEKFLKIACDQFVIKLEVKKNENVLIYALIEFCPPSV